MNRESPPDMRPPAGGDDDRPCLGGLFPLPEVHVEQPMGRCSRRSSQRRGRRIQEQCDLNEAIRGLNWLAGAPLNKGVFGPSPRQQEVLGRVTAACHRAATKPDQVAPLSPEAAFSELLRGNASVYEATGATLAPFKLERVSLPESVHDCPQVIDLVDSDARQYLEDSQRMLLPADQVECDVVPYWDPTLRSSCASKYRSLIQRLHKIGYLLESCGACGDFHGPKIRWREAEAHRGRETSQCGTPAAPSCQSLHS